MTPALFTAQTGSARELCQLDWNRNIIPRDKQTMFCAEIIVECKTHDKSIDVEFLARTEVKLSRVSALNDSRERTEAVASLMAQEGIPRFAKCGELEIYRGETVGLWGDSPVPPADEPYRYEKEEELNDQLTKQLRDATTRHRDTAVRFEQAKEYLDHNLDSLRYDPSRARSHARFLADCMCKSGSPFMAAWNAEKSSRLVGAVDDLIRRKNSNHSGYTRNAEWLRGILYQIHPEKLWHSYPP